MNYTITANTYFQLMIGFFKDEGYSHFNYNPGLTESHNSCTRNKWHIKCAVKCPEDTTIQKNKNYFEKNIWRKF